MEHTINYSVEELKQMNGSVRNNKNDDYVLFYNGKAIVEILENIPIPGEIFRQFNPSENEGSKYLSQLFKIAGYKFDDKKIECSNYGRIRIDEKIVKQEKLRRGYLVADIPEFKKSGKEIWTYRIIASVWVVRPNSNEILHVHHITNNGYDNRPENLIWLSQKEHLNGVHAGNSYNFLNYKIGIFSDKGFTDEEFIERYDYLHEKAWHYRDVIKAYQEKNKNYRDDAFDKDKAEMRYNLGCGEVIDIDKASENEVWKKLTNSGYTKYAVSSLGRVAFLREGNYYIIKQDDFQTKYYLRLTPDEKFHVDRQIEVYKLIAMGFLGKNIGDGYDVHHIINDGYNCCPDNLILLSRKQHNAVHNTQKLQDKELREFLKD